MSVATGIALAAVGTASAVSASQQKKAAKSAAAGQAAGSKAQLDFYRQQAGEYSAALEKAIRDGKFEFPSVDAGAQADLALGVTTRNLPGVLANTRTAYDASADNFARYLNAAFGQDSRGQDALPQERTAVNDVVLDQLKGRLSSGTRTLLGRQALSSGAVGLGQGAVQDAFTYKLGLASEEQVQRGVENYGSLYQTYGRFAPQISPLDFLPFGGLSTAQSLQNAQFNAQGEFQAGLAEVQAILGGITMETGTVGPAIGPATMGPYLTRAAGYQGNAAIAEAIGSTVGALAGAYGAAQTMGQYNSLLGSSVPSQLSAGEAAFNRANGIEDRTVSGYYGDGGMGFLRGGAFAGSQGSSLLQLFRQLQKQRAS